MARKSQDEVQKLAPYLVGPDGNLSQDMVDALMLAQITECIRIYFYDITDILEQGNLYKMNLKKTCKQFEEVLNKMLTKAYHYYRYLDNHSLFGSLAAEFSNAFDISINDIFTKYVMIDILIDDLTEKYESYTEIKNWDVVKDVPSIRSRFNDVKSHLDKILTDLPSRESVFDIFDKGTTKMLKEELWLYGYFDMTNEYDHADITN